MRLFIAIEIPESIRSAFTSLLKDFRALAPQLKWVRPENLHVTLKFLGETDPEKLGPLQSFLSDVRTAEPVHLEFRGLGVFPNEKRPRVFWAGMEASPNLKTLAADIDQAVHQLGFSLEERSYAPHLTLSRISLPDIPPILLQAIHEKSRQTFGSIRATEFHLIESKLKPAGAEYTTVQSFHFASEA